MFAACFLHRGPSIILLWPFDYFFKRRNLFLVPRYSPTGLAPHSRRLIPIDVISVFDQRFTEKEENEHTLRPFAHVWLILTQDILLLQDGCLVNAELLKVSTWFKNQEMLVSIVLVRAIFLELIPALVELSSFVNNQVDKFHETVTYKL